MDPSALDPELGMGHRFPDRCNQFGVAAAAHLQHEIFTEDAEGAAAGEGDYGKVQTLQPDRSAPVTDAAGNVSAL